MVRVPAIIVGHHRNDGVRQFRLAGELGFGHRRHADDAGAPGAVEIALGERGELRSLHADIGATSGIFDVFLGASSGERVGKARIDGMGHRNMGDEARTEKALFAREGAIDELVGDDELARRQLLLQRTACGDGDQVRDARALQDVDIGAVVDRTRRVDVAAAMARQEDEVGALVAAEQQRIGWLAPGRFEPLPMRLFEAGNVIDAAAADDAEDGSGHGELLAWGIASSIVIPGRANKLSEGKGTQVERQRDLSNWVPFPHFARKTREVRRG